MNQLDNTKTNSDIHQVINQSTQLVKELLGETQYLASEFRLGITPELSLEFDESLSSIQTLMSTMLTLQFVSRRNDEFNVIWAKSYPIWEDTEKLFKSSLNAMLRAYGHEDYVGLADILEDELSESLFSWQKFIGDIARNMPK